jgi:hypothetical protein
MTDLGATEKYGMDKKTGAMPRLKTADPAKER